MKHVMLKVQLITAIAQPGVKKARSPTGSVQCKQGSLCEQEPGREEEREKKEQNARQERGRRERATAQTASAGGHAVLRIRLSMNLINTASLISSENIPLKASRSALHLPPLALSQLMHTFFFSLFPSI